MTVRADKINAFIKAAGVNVEPFWTGLFTKEPHLQHRGWWTCPSSWYAPAGGPALSTAAAAPAEEKKMKAKKEEYE